MSILKKILSLAFFVLLLFLFPKLIYAQDVIPTNQQFYKAEVLDISPLKTEDLNGVRFTTQEITLKIENGDKNGQTVKIEDTKEANTKSLINTKPGDIVVITNVPGPNSQTGYSIVDKYRLNVIPYLLIFFFIVILLVARLKGLGSVLGMAASLLIIAGFIVPQIIAGSDPMTITIIGSLIILLVSTYLAHGISKQTTIALISTFAALMFTAILAVLVVKITSLFGLGNEDVSSFQFGPTTAKINLQGLLLSGIIIGTLGALNDVTTTQATTILELAKAVEKPKFAQLFKKGLIIGREHIVSLVNTLILAYAGSSMALFIFLSLNPNKEPLWVILNSETIMDEVARAIIGSTGLILSVPFVTLIAAWYFSTNRTSR